MRTIYLLLLVSLLYVVSAKYLPDENASRVVALRKQRSISDESNISTQSTEEDDDDDDHSDSVEQKRIEEQLKLQEKKDKEERRRLERERKLQEKILEQERKLQEKLERAERKRQEKLEKEERKRQEEERKKEEKLAKEERKRQEKLQKQLEKIEKKTIKESELINDNSSESQEDDSMDLEDIWKSYVYSKNALPANSSDLEKAAVVNRYLQEEFGLNVNSTRSEYRQAVLQIIQNKLSNDSATGNGFHNYLVSRVNAAYVQRLTAELETKIAQLDNETALLENVTFPWVSEAQQSIKQQKTILQSVVQYLASVLPNWITEGQATSDNTNGTNVGSSDASTTSSNNTPATNNQGNPAASLPNLVVSGGDASSNGPVGEGLVNDVQSGSPSSSSDVTSSITPTGLIQDVSTGVAVEPSSIPSTGTQLSTNGDSSVIEVTVNTSSTIDSLNNDVSVSGDISPNSISGDGSASVVHLSDAEAEATVIGFTPAASSEAAATLANTAVSAIDSNSAIGEETTATVSESLSSSTSGQIHTNSPNAISIDVSNSEVSPYVITSSEASISVTPLINADTTMSSPSDVVSPDANSSSDVVPVEVGISTNGLSSITSTDTSVQVDTSSNTILVDASISTASPSGANIPEANSPISISTNTISVDLSATPDTSSASVVSVDGISTSEVTSTGAQPSSGLSDTSAPVNVVTDAVSVAVSAPTDAELTGVTVSATVLSSDAPSEASPSVPVLSGDAQVPSVDAISPDVSVVSSTNAVAVGEGASSDDTSIGVSSSATMSPDTVPADVSPASTGSSDLVPSDASASVPVTSGTAELPSTSVATLAEAISTDASVVVVPSDNDGSVGEQDSVVDQSISVSPDVTVTENTSTNAPSNVIAEDASAAPSFDAVSTDMNTASVGPSNVAPSDASSPLFVPSDAAPIDVNESVISPVLDSVFPDANVSDAISDTTVVTEATETAPSSTDGSQVITNEITLLVTESSIVGSSNGTVINTDQIPVDPMPVDAASNPVEVAAPSEVILNGSIATVTNDTGIIVDSEGSESSVADAVPINVDNTPGNEISVTDSIVPSTEPGNVVNTENIVDSMSTSVPQVPQENANTPSAPIIPLEAGASLLEVTTQ